MRLDLRGLDLSSVPESADTLRTYALIYERADRPGGPLHPPSDISLTVARCLRLVAGLKDVVSIQTAAAVQSETVGDFLEAKYGER